MTELTQIGFILVFIGVLVIIIGSFFSQSESDSKVFVGGILGFIPFGFSNDRQLFYAGLAITVLLFLAWLIFSGRLG